MARADSQNCIVSGSRKLILKWSIFIQLSAFRECRHRAINAKLRVCVPAIFRIFAQLTEEPETLCIQVDLHTVSDET